MLVEQIVVQEMSTIVGMSNSYMHKEQMMKQLQTLVADQGDSIHSKEDFVRVIDAEVESMKADVNTTIDMIARTLKSIPFDIFLKASKK